MEKGTVVLRPRRQVTLPREVCEALDIKPGDRLVLEVADGVLVARPGRKAALDALEELRRAMAESGVTEEELLESGRQVREELFKERYGYLLQRKPKGRKRSA
jgi:AbrB family looped-hinge helix DNA binding protein